MFDRLVYHGVTLLAGLAIASLTATSIASAKPLSGAETRAIAKEAYLYGFPMVEAYKTLYAQAVDKGGANFKAPFNTIGNTASVFTPKDTAIITPNSDTPYSFVWMDFRVDCRSLLPTRKKIREWL